MEFLLAIGKRLFDRTPQLKKTVKYLFRDVIAKYDKRQGLKYQRWLDKYILSDTELKNQALDAKKLPYRPLLSIIVPTYNTNEVFFSDMLNSVVAQTYDNWELILIDDASPQQSIRDLIIEAAKTDPRIKYKFLHKNLHIAGATNEAIRMASGEFISLFDHDDLLWPNALYEIAGVLNKHEADLIYTDEEKIAGDAKSNLQPFFKPDWNPDFLRSVNYITHFTTIRKDILDKYGYEDGRFNGAQDWELFLRLTRNIPAAKILHIPKILYSWRIHDASTANLIEVKPYVGAAQREVLQTDLQERGYQNSKVIQDELYSAQWLIKFKPAYLPKVTIILLDGLNNERMHSHIASQTRYADYEVISVVPGVTVQQIVKQCSGEYVILVDQDLCIQDSHWIEDMLGDAMRDTIGLVLARCREKEVMNNLLGILNKNSVDFIAHVNRRFGIKHLYLTTRYNIGIINSGVVMVKTEKLINTLHNQNEQFDMMKLSQDLVEQHYHNLYNPRIKVIK